MMDPLSRPGLPAMPSAQIPQPKDISSSEKTAREFEAVFLGQMTRIMMESVETDGQFSGGHAEEMFRSVLAEQLGSDIAKRGGVGLAPAVMDQIIRLQGGKASGQ